ncbi:hypothetical protein Syun_008745 [Stephania yunnanensis]|uniref:non-specific serine/threonine protein kinase n=1 Tax=Stephania yunnanensis TaxID=152371 RepID=A0AAP0KD60_9MAGN
MMMELDDSQKIISTFLSLADLIKDHYSDDGGMPKSGVKAFAKSILLDLEYTHKKGYAHLDINPDNIVLVPRGDHYSSKKMKIKRSANSGASTDDFVAKIVDFATAKSFNQISAEQQQQRRKDWWFFRGTPGYMSPELIAECEKGSASDVWGLGCVMVEMLCGRANREIQISVHLWMCVRVAMRACVRLMELVLDPDLSSSLAEELQRLATSCKDGTMPLLQLEVNAWGSFCTLFALFSFDSVLLARITKMAFPSCACLSKLFIPVSKGKMLEVIASIEFPCFIIYDLSEMALLVEGLGVGGETSIEDLKKWDSIEQRSCGYSLRATRMRSWQQIIYWITCTSSRIDAKGIQTELFLVRRYVYHDVDLEKLIDCSYVQTLFTAAPFHARMGRYPPVVRTAVPVNGRFEHIVLSCNATSDHAIIWIEREAQRVLDDPVIGGKNNARSIVGGRQDGAIDDCFRILVDAQEHCRSKRSTSLDWEMRRDIILGIARGVLYLHQDSILRIVHRDLKASNVLLRRRDE